MVDGVITDGLVDGEWISGSSWTTSELAKMVAPPAHRAADSGASGFYGKGCLAVLGWMVGGAVLCTVLAAFPPLVILVVVVAVLGGVVQLIRMIAGTPKSTPDQHVAQTEWEAAYADWQRQWLCQRCGETFVPEEA